MAAAANLISVEVSRRVGRIHELLVQQPPQRARPRADARPHPPKDLHARLIELAGASWGVTASATSSNLEIASRKRSEMSSTGAPSILRSLQRAWRWPRRLARRVWQVPPGVTGAGCRAGLASTSHQPAIPKSGNPRRRRLGKASRPHRSAWARRQSRVAEGFTGGVSPASLSGPSQGTTRRPTARSATAHAPRKGSSGERCRTRGLVADRRLDPAALAPRTATLTGWRLQAPHRNALVTPR
jgi:hypothetical protein